MSIVDYVLLAYSLLLGLAVGSFILVAARRGVRDEPLRGRSRCESCGATLSAKELIPLVSFILQKGRCRHCGAVLSLQYPAVEATVAALFIIVTLLFFVLHGFAWDIESIALLIAVYIGISAGMFILVADFLYNIIPNGATVTLALLGIAATVYRHYAGVGGRVIIGSSILNQGIVYDAGAALGIALFFTGMWFVSKGKWMGFGDVKLVPATSLLLGFPASFVAFLFAFWTGGISGLILLLMGRRGLKSQIPFGPFILLGAAMAYFLTPWFLSISRFAILLQ